MPSPSYSIGQLAAETGCKVTTIRYYEQIGLVPAPPRSEGGQRRYSHAHLETLGFIRHARELGFATEAIRELLILGQQQEEGDCHRADEIAAAHLRRVEQKLARLQRLRDELKLMINACQAGRDHRCQVLSVLSDHQRCHHEH